MRFRFGMPLPGPFYLSPGGKGGGSGCAMLLGAALVIGFAIEWPWLIAVAAGLIVIPAVAVAIGRRGVIRRTSGRRTPESPRNERMGASDRRSRSRGERKS